MVGPRRKNLIASRRRADDDGEEEGSLAAGIEDDSSSQASSPSDLDEDADAEGSDASEIVTPGKNGTKKSNGEPGLTKGNGTHAEPVVASDPATFSPAIADTEVMLNGMNISEGAGTAAEVHFDTAHEQAEVLEAPVEAPVEAPAGEEGGKLESPLERKRREHEEYKKKRDADPAFVPNRGGFFMHDHRVNMPGQNGFRPSGRGRGRGRGGIGGAFSPIGHAQTSSNPADAPWTHDLHETVVDEGESKHETARASATASQHTSQQFKAPAAAQRTPPPNRSFSRTVQVGNVQLRVFLPGMTSPIVFSAVPVNSHTRLPHHRPPLRRDKPVRVSLPNFPPRYIFPAVERSFIFIPRALRPNQQTFNRGRGSRGSFGTYGAFPSGRTSAYGGSVYSPSIAMSRRSSMAREIGREGLVSPAGSVMSRNRSVIMDASKPVVRLPPPGEVVTSHPSMRQSSYPTTPAPVVNLPMPQVYPQPQNPLSHETLPINLTMHQPRPQKAVSVAGIESPAGYNFQPPQQQQQQPFHQQVPVSVNGQGYGHSDLNIYNHLRRPSHPSQRGTPLSQIPERAIHAHPFQPYPYQQQPPQGYYAHPQQYAAPVYYYPPPPGHAPMAPSMDAPPFVPGQQYPYMVPAPAPAAPAEPTTQPGTVAHESNGMVYYYDSSQLPPPVPPPVPVNEDPSAYQAMGYAPPNGFIMAPQPAVYGYPPQ